MIAKDAAMPRAAKQRAQPKDRIDSAAYELFSRHGIRAVGVDKVIAQSGVAKMTLYRHYPTKEKLALAFLRKREELWTRAWLQNGVERRAGTPRARLLAIFDVFDRWFRRADFEGCSFINVLLEIDDRGSPVRSASAHHLAEIRTFLARLAAEAGIRNADDFARKWHILMKGSIIAAGDGDREAALRAKDIGALLLTHSVGRKRPRHARAG